MLWGVWCDGPDHALIVGDGGAIHRLEDGAWRGEESGVNEPLHAVVGFGDHTAVAVGWMGVIVHREGAGWRRHGGGIVDPITKRYARTRANTPLFGLWASSPGDVWAVGDEGRVCRFDGAEWHEVDCPTDVHLRAVVRCRDGTLMVAGAQGSVLAFQDGEWARMETGTSTHLTGLHAGDDGTVYAVGGQFNVRRNGFAGTVVHLRDGTWTVLDSDEPLPRLRAIERVGDAVLAIGDHGTVARIEGDRIVTERVDTRRDLYGLAPAGGQRALCVGDGGTIIERTTVSAAALPSIEVDAAPVGRASPWEAVDGCPTDRVLWSVWGSDDHVVAVGDEGAIVAFDGTRWLSHPAPSPLHLHGVWGRRADQVYAVGDFASVIEFDGTRWREIHRLGVDVSAVAVAGFGPHDLFVVGDEGLILRSDGVGFERVDGKTRDALYALWGMDADHVLAVGDFGAILRWNGREWSKLLGRHRGIPVRRRRPRARRHRGGRPVGQHRTLRRPPLVAARDRHHRRPARRGVARRHPMDRGRHPRDRAGVGRRRLDRGGHRHGCRPARGVGGCGRHRLGGRGRRHGTQTHCRSAETENEGA